MSISYELVIPVGIGLGIGISFVIILTLLATISVARITEHENPRIAYDAANKLTEVKVFLSRYPFNLVTLALSRDSREETVQLDYAVQKAIDTDGDGIRETIHRLDLFLTYDESQGLISTNQNARLLRMNATCTEPSPSNVYNWIYVDPPAIDGQVLDYIRNSTCIN